MVHNCGLCNREITEEEFMADGICEECLCDILYNEEAHEQSKIITREMALDVGMPELEGCEW